MLVRRFAAIATVDTCQTYLLDYYLDFLASVATIIWYTSEKIDMHSSSS